MSDFERVSKVFFPLKAVAISDARGWHGSSRINLSHRYVFTKHSVSQEYRRETFIELRRICRARDRRWKMTGLILIAAVLALVDTYDHWLRTRFVMTSLCVQRSWSQHRDALSRTWHRAMSRERLSRGNVFRLN